MSSFERCCFRVDVEASGRLVQGTDEVAWRWSARQVARYVQHGRIFNALTGIEDVGTASIFRGSFETRSARNECTRRIVASVFEPAPGAYASLEDGPDGRVTLIVRSGARGRKLARCIPSTTAAAARLGGPFVYELTPPAGESLRFDRRMFIVVQRASGQGVSTLRVRLTHFPPAQLERQLTQLRFRTKPIPPPLERAR